MRIARFTLCLQVRDVAAATAFYTTHFGYRVLLDHGVFSKLRHGEGHELFFLQCGARVSPDDVVDAQPAAGLILALEVSDAAAELARLRDAGVAITGPLRDEPWGERLFQVRDPNGVTVQLVQWTQPPAGHAP